MGNIMPYVTREAPSTTSFCHDDSTVIYFLTCDNDYTQKKGVAGRFSKLQHRCTRLHSMRLETEARCQQQVHYLTINLSFTAENQDLREAIDFGRLRRGSLCDHGTVYCRQGDYHLHPFYEAYLLKLFSHSHLLLYTEDLVVLKSVLIRSRGGLEPGDLLFLRVPHG